MINLPVDEFDSLVAAMTSELSFGCTRLHVDEEQKTTSDLISFICDDAELCDELFDELEQIWIKRNDVVVNVMLVKHKAALKFCDAWARTEYQPVDENGVAV